MCENASRCLLDQSGVGLETDFKGLDVTHVITLEPPLSPPHVTSRGSLNRSLGGESNREIVSFRFVRACVRTVWLPSGIRSQKWLPFFPRFPLSLFGLSLFLFWLGELSLFPCVSDV